MQTHKEIGIKQQLFYFHELSPGCCFFLPHGTRIVEAMMKVLKKEYKKHDYQLVITPQIVKKELLEISGHWENYKDDMFIFNDNDQIYGLKPMNCPGHCLIYKSIIPRSYRELPIKFADFSMLHRNEASGALNGLFRTKCFQQDDAHIFCAKHQIKEQIQDCLDLLETVYSWFNLEFTLELSTRPESKYIGSLKDWEIAETQLASALHDYYEKTGKNWKVNEGDGAFYGPKIDIHVLDSLGRSHQCATIQLDMNLPNRFDLKFINEHQELEQPVIIHRAIYGSFGRFLGVLTEHYQGKWPMWLSPRQVIIMNINSDCIDYAKKVYDTMKQEKEWYIDVDFSDSTISKKILLAQQLCYNYIVVVGPKEQENGTVNVRWRDSTKQKSMKLYEFMISIYSPKPNE